MAGKIFYRERRKVERGEKKPRYTVVGVYDIKLDFIAEHFRRSELEQIAQATGAELILLSSEEKSKKYHETE